MSRIFNLGSLNLDHVYRVPRFVQPGETMSVDGYERHLGGKGYNHSAAIAKAHGTVVHIGACPTADLAAFQVVPAPTLAWHIEPSAQPAGHAIIQVDTHGENQILLFPGANRTVTQHHLDTLAAGPDAPEPGDWFLAQNETNLVKEALQWAKSLGLRTAYAAAPFDAEAIEQILPYIDAMALNAVEAQQLQDSMGRTIDQLGIDLVVVTKGGDGVSLWHQDRWTDCPAFSVDKIVDTTGAGDCFFGSFLAELAQGQQPSVAIRFAQAAAALSVTQTGASTSYADRSEVEKFLAEHA